MKAFSRVRAPPPTITLLCRLVRGREASMIYFKDSSQREIISIMRLGVAMPIYRRLHFDAMPRAGNHRPRPASKAFHDGEMMLSQNQPMAIESHEE